MKRTGAAAMLLLAALTQVTWAPRLQIAGAFPNLVLLIVIAIAWQRGVRAAMVAACAGGVLLDLSSAGPVGPHVMALLAGVYATGFWIRNVESPNAIHAALTTALSTVIYALVLVLADVALGNPSVGLTAGVELAAVAAVYNAILAPLAFAAVRSLDSLGRAPEAR